MSLQLWREIVDILQIRQVVSADSARTGWKSIIKVIKVILQKGIGSESEIMEESSR